MISTDTVKRAIQGDNEHIVVILNHYKRYIRKLCAVHVGCGKYELDEDMEAEVTQHLMFAIMGLGGKEQWKKFY